MHVGAMVAQGLAMVALPVAAVALVRRLGGAGAGPVVAGALAFVGAQVVHLPLNAGVAALARGGALPTPSPETSRWLVPVLLGLSAGICEETARWISLRRRRTPGEAAATGIGHGGVEAVLLGVMVLLTAVQLLAVDEATLPEAAAAQVRAVREASDLLALAGFAERVAAMSAHLGMSMLVGLAVVRRSVLPWLAALLAHAALDAGAVALLPRGGLVVEGFVAACGVAGLGIAIASARSWPRPPDLPPPAPSPPDLRERPLRPADAAHDRID